MIYVYVRGYIMSNLIYTASDKGHLDLRLAEKSISFHSRYGGCSKYLTKDREIAHGMVDYRKSLVLKASRVGMTLESYCKRFNIKL